MKITQEEHRQILDAFAGSWDDGVKTYEKFAGKNFWAQLYWFAYEFADATGDVDNGTCGTLRSKAVEKIYSTLEREKLLARNGKA